MKKNILLIIFCSIVLFDSSALSSTNLYAHFNVQSFKKTDNQLIGHTLQLLQSNVRVIYVYQSKIFGTVLTTNLVDNSDVEIDVYAESDVVMESLTTRADIGVVVPLNVEAKVRTDLSELQNKEGNMIIKEQIDLAIDQMTSKSSEDEWQEIVEEISNNTDEEVVEAPEEIVLTDVEIEVENIKPMVRNTAILIAKEDPQEREINQNLNDSSLKNKESEQEIFDGEMEVETIQISNAKISDTSMLIGDPVDALAAISEDELFNQKLSTQESVAKKEMIISTPGEIAPIEDEDEGGNSLTLEEKLKMLPEGYTLEITDGIYQIDLKSKGFWTLDDALLKEDFKVPEDIQRNMGIDPFVDPKLRSSESFIGEQMNVSGTITEMINKQSDVIKRNSSTNKFIVKFKSDWPHTLDGCAQSIFTKGEQFRNYMIDGSSSIDELNRICRIKSVKSVFMNRGGLNSFEAKRKQDHIISNIKKKYSKRSKRVSQSIEIPDLTNTYRFEAPEGSQIDKICELYTNDPHVEYAHPDQMIRHDAFPVDPPDDPNYSLLYGLNNTGQTAGIADADIDAPEGWNFTGGYYNIGSGSNLGSGAIIAVVDTGVDWAHQDLAANIWSNPNEILNGLDDDGNGLIDDIRGWDFTTCTTFDFIGNCIGAKAPDNNPFDGDGHGTHVSGTAAAVGDNAIGIIGVAPSAKIMPLKALSDTGDGFFSWAADAILYAVANGADVINNSYGCTPSAGCASQPTMEAAVQVAYAAGVIVIFSAGNDNLDVADASPQNMQPETIVVAATDHNDARATFSNFGNLIDVSAPGVSIISTLPLNQYGFFNGTSMSAPHVSGLAASLIAAWDLRKLDLSFLKELDVFQFRGIIRQATEDLGAVGFDTLYGVGRINLERTLDFSTTFPNLAAIGNMVVTDGSLIEFGVSATDPQGEITTLRVIENLPTGATFIDNMDNTGTFSWVPNLGNTIPVMVTDIKFQTQDSDRLSRSKTVDLTINPFALCGNSIIEFGENCDDGGTIGGDGCSAVCMLESCGDGVLDPAEFCDDGNLVNGDGCNDLCQIEICGNSILDVGEECDDGNLIAGDGCNGVCVQEICGNGVIDVGEDCDDGNLLPGDGCGASCKLEVCGNAVLDIGEGCDDGNTNSGDGCSDMCIDEFCGDGIVNDNGIEQCDDGNIIEGDGCESCQLSAFCGDGQCDLQRSETCATCQTDCGPCRGLRPRI